MSGFEVLVSLVARPRRPKMPVIILPRLNFRPLAELTVKNGAQAYLIKARVSGDDLDLAIQKALATVGSTHLESCI